MLINRVTSRVTFGFRVGFRVQGFYTYNPYQGTSNPTYDYP